MAMQPNQLPGQFPGYFKGTREPLPLPGWQEGEGIPLGSETQPK